MDEAAAHNFFPNTCKECGQPSHRKRQYCWKCKPAKRTCANCKGPTTFYRRRLCRKCYEDKSIRFKFEMVAVCGLGARNLNEVDGEVPPADKPVTAARGTKERLEQLAARARRKVSLTHPDDS